MGIMMKPRKHHLRLRALLDEFLAGSLTRSWLYGRYLEVYVRKSKRMIEGEVRPCLDVATVGIPKESQRGKGHFRDFMIYAEQVNPFYAIYVEYAESELTATLIKNGYRIIPNAAIPPDFPQCLYKVQNDHSRTSV